MILPTDIHSLTDFQRRTKAHLKKLKASGRPEALTINGKAELVVQAADAYQDLMDEFDRLEAMIGISQGLLDLERGNEEPIEKVLNELGIQEK